MINQLDEGGERHGPWEAYWSHNQLMYKGEYKNGKGYGLWESYYSDGKTLRKGEYKNGRGRGLWYESKYTR